MLKQSPRWQLLVGLIAIALAAAACFQQVGDVPQANAVSERNSETPTDIPTNTTTNTARPSPTDAPESTEAQAVDQPVSELATPAGTAVAQAGEGETGQEQQEQEEQPGSFQLTATQLIRNATMTAEFPITQTAFAEGLGATETPTPTVGPTQDPFAVQTPTQVFVSGTDCVHEVRAGETMWRLSFNYGVSVNEISAANAIVNPNLILVGQRITIPGCGTTGFVPPPTSTPLATSTPFGFAQGGAEGVDLSGQSAGTPAQPIVSTCGSQYIVQQYDTLFQISLACGVPVQSIANANGITNINRVDMGQILVIPSQ